VINTETELPEGWDWQRLDDLLVCLESGTRPKGGAVGIFDGVPSLSAEHMTVNGTFDFSNIRYVPYEFYSQMNRGHIQQDDILIVKDGATTGKTCFVDESFPFSEAVINEHVFICRANLGKVYPKYLFFWLWGEAAQAAIQSTFQGAAIGGINQKFVEKVFVPLPSLPEQKRIATILTEQLAAVEKARKASEARLEAARTLPAAYLREIFESDESQRWQESTIGEIALEVQNGIYKSSEFYGEGKPFLRMYNVENTSWHINQNNLAKVIIDANEQTKFELKKGDLLISRVNSHELVGKCAWVTDEEEGYVFENMLIRVKLSSDVDSKFVAQQISTKALKEQIQGKAKRAIGQSSINATDIKQIKIRLPPLKMQHILASQLENDVSRSYQLHKLLKEEYEAIATIPMALLKQAFSGAM
jgi:type I restriction enzyme S subunit